MSEKTLLALEEIYVSYQRTHGSAVSVLDNLNIKIRENEIIAVVGASGVGKSTALRVLAGLQRPTSGEVLLEGKRILGVNPDVGVVFQDVTLYPWLTVAENVEFGLFPQGLDLRTRRQRVAKAVDSVGLKGFEEAYPRELSGGMRQRVSIARTLAMAPKVLCLDEPFSALDTMTAETLAGEVLDIWQKKNSNLKSILLITHDIKEAVYLSNRIIVLGQAPNNVKAEIAIDLKYPRDVNSWQFNQLVRRIHDVFTETILSDKPASTQMEEQSLWVLPPVSIPDVIGLTELLASNNASMDVFKVPELMEKELGDALMAIKAAELMDLVDTPHHRVLLTRLGQQVADGDVNERKKVVRSQLRSLKLVQMLIQLLENQPDSELPYDQLIEWVQSKVPALNPKTSLDTLIDWGRYGEILRFNSDTAILSLEASSPTI
jgi:NitT/TauT family transport system ATP-binding protein